MLTDRLSGQFPPTALLVPLVALPAALLVVLVEPTLTLAGMLAVLLIFVTFMSPLAGVYVLVFSMLLGPEFLVGNMGAGATLGRGVTLRLDDFILVLVGLAWMARTALSRDRAVVVRTPVNRPIMLYVAACVLATLLGVLAQRVSPSGGFFFLLKYYEYFFLFFMTITLVRTQRQVRLLVLCSLVTCLAVALYALAQIPSGVRVSAPFEGSEGEPNTLGGYLVFMMAIITGFLLTPESMPRKAPLVLLLGLAGIALQATLSRSSFLAAIVLIVIVVLYLTRRSPLALALVLTGLVAMPFWLPPAVSERVLYTFMQPQEAGQIQVGRLRVDTSTSDRLRSWQTAYEEFRKSPLWGVGVTGGPFMDAMYPRVLMETGLLGFAAFLLLLSALLKLARRAHRESQDPFNRALALGFLFGTVGLMVHAIGSNTFIIVRIMEPYWLYAALVTRTVLGGEGDLSPVARPAALSDLPPERSAVARPRTAAVLSVSREEGLHPTRP